MRSAGSSGDDGDTVTGQPASTRPYLIRAIHEWALDNGFTPQILVAADHDQVIVPMEHVNNDRIVLNVHPQSVKNLELGNEYLMCSARFSGRPFEITVPIGAIQAIYARENGQGIVFQEESPPPDSPPQNGSASSSGKGPGGGGGSHLKLVK